MGSLRERRALLAAASATVGLGPLLFARHARAQAWPSKPIRILVGFPPGGLTDAYARMYAEQLSAKVGQSVVVENRPGAGAIIAIDAVAKSPPDGYTLLFTTSGSVWQNRVLYRKLPFDADRDLTPISLFPSGPLVMGVPATLAVRTMREWIDYARKNPTSMGTYAAASVPHMVADQVNRAYGTKIESIHYKGESPMWVDVASGQVQGAIGSYQAFAAMQAKGLVRAIAVTGPTRSPKLPDTPTLLEQGMDQPLFKLDGWLPLLAPAGTPPEIVARLSAAAIEGAETPKSAQLRDNFAIPTKPTTLDETRRRWRDESAVWIKLADDLGIKLD